MLRLIIGNKNYSSWSLRPWLGMKVAGIAFEEMLIPLDAPDFKARLATFGGAGKVPLLIDGEIRVWVSLAILEYLAEKFPAAGLWPPDAGARAHARAVASEMHSGFAALRSQLPMNVARRVVSRPLDAGASADAARIQSIWSESRKRFVKTGRSFLARSARRTRCTRQWCGAFTLTRSKSVSAARNYMVAMMELPAWNEWREAARRETSVLPHDEVDWPEVKREED